MTIQAPSVARSLELFRMLDADDGPGMLALCADDVQKADETTNGWLRGKSGMAGHLAEGLPLLAECRSRLEDVAVVRNGDVEIETFMLHQSYVYDGTRHDIVAPTSVVWRWETGRWRIALIHSVPMPPAG